MDRGLDWEEQRKKALIRDHYTCRKCWKKTKSVHHILPFEKAQHNRLLNLITLCPSCHRTEESKNIRYGLTGWMKKQVKSNQRIGLKSLLNK